MSGILFVHLSKEESVMQGIVGSIYQSASKVASLFKEPFEGTVQAQKTQHGKSITVLVNFAKQELPGFLRNRIHPLILNVRIDCFSILNIV